MHAALENLAGLTDKNKIAILGDMFELGKEAAAEHQKINDLIAILNIDKAYLIGENFNNTMSNNPKVELFKTYDIFKAYFSKLNIEKATLLIKASRGMALERVVDLL
jgi:UDP-N-acetylmuramoyl-tripeptide--D-alanyl-D-alanine ligase